MEFQKKIGQDLLVWNAATEKSRSRGPTWGTGIAFRNSPTIWLIIHWWRPIGECGQARFFNLTNYYFATSFAAGTMQVQEASKKTFFFGSLHMQLWRVKSCFMVTTTKTTSTPLPISSCHPNLNMLRFIPSYRLELRYPTIKKASG